MRPADQKAHEILRFLATCPSPDHTEHLTNTGPSLTGLAQTGTRAFRSFPAPRRLPPFVLCEQLHPACQRVDPSSGKRRTMHAFMVAKTPQIACVQVGAVDPNLAGDAESNITFGLVRVIVTLPVRSGPNAVGTSGGQ